VTFSCFAIGFLITIIVFVVSGVFGLILGTDNADRLLGSWLISSVGFGICLTILLIQNGIIN